MYQLSSWADVCESVYVCVTERAYGPVSAFRNVLKKQLSYSLVYPRVFLPKYMHTIYDPLENLSKWERFTYLFMVFVFDFAITQVWAMVAFSVFPPPLDSDDTLVRPLLSNGCKAFCVVILSAVSRNSWMGDQETQNLREPVGSSLYPFHLNRYLRRTN